MPFTYVFQPWNETENPYFASPGCSVKKDALRGSLRNPDSVQK